MPVGAKEDEMTRTQATKALIENKENLLSNRISFETFSERNRRIWDRVAGDKPHTVENRNADIDAVTKAVMDK